MVLCCIQKRIAAEPIARSYIDDKRIFFIFIEESAVNICVQREMIRLRILGIEGHVGGGNNIPRISYDGSVCQRPMLETGPIVSLDAPGPVVNVFSVGNDIGDLSQLRIIVEIAAVRVKGDYIAVSPAGIKSHVAGDGYAVVFPADEVSSLFRVIPTRERRVFVRV